MHRTHTLYTISHIHHTVLHPIDLAQASVALCRALSASLLNVLLHSLCLTSLKMFTSRGGEIDN